MTGPTYAVLEIYTDIENVYKGIARTGVFLEALWKGSVRDIEGRKNWKSRLNPASLSVCLWASLLVFSGVLQSSARYRLFQWPLLRHQFGVKTELNNRGQSDLKCKIVTQVKII